MPSIASSSLAVTLMVAGYLSARCTTSPNPNLDRAKRYQSDRLAILVDFSTEVWKRLPLVLSGYHALVTLFYPPEHNPQLEMFCPHPQNLSDEHVTWNGTILTYLGMIFVGAFIRLSAYGGLGRNFTFHLANPDRLITSGIYQYMQHPSYTGAALVTFGMAGALMRWDTATGACWMQPWMMQSLDGYGYIFAVSWGIFFVSIIRVRVADEEKMLKEQFGKEWEEWHRQTKRFIPGVI